ncbi:MAG TPA: RDD family protein [Abditibacteriaceae bacterium]|jgi:uncharacterized RDD family membrane protein YckC
MPRTDWNDEVDILSAENVSFAIETAGLGSRMGAALIDLSIQGFVIILLLLGASWVSGYVLPLIKGWSAWAQALGAALIILVGVTITHGYYFLFEWLWDGQTPGKRWLGLRVVQTSGMPITVWESLTRNLLRTVDFLPGFYGAGALVALINPLNRRIGDMVAGTIVARERHDAHNTVLNIDAAADAFLAAYSGGVPAGSITSDTAASGATLTKSPLAVHTTNVQASEYSIRINEASAPAAVADPREAALVARLDAQDIELLHEFMTRRSRLQAVPRERLAHSVARRLTDRFQQPMPSPELIEPFLENVARALRQNS